MTTSHTPFTKIALDYVLDENKIEKGPDELLSNLVQEKKRQDIEKQSFLHRSLHRVRHLCSSPAKLPSLEILQRSITAKKDDPMTQLLSTFYSIHPEKLDKKNASLLTLDYSWVQTVFHKKLEEKIKPLLKKERQPDNNLTALFSVAKQEEIQSQLTELLNKDDPECNSRIIKGYTIALPYVENKKLQDTLLAKIVDSCKSSRFRQQDAFYAMPQIFSQLTSKQQESMLEHFQGVSFNSFHEKHFHYRIYSEIFPAVKEDKTKNQLCTVLSNQHVIEQRIFYFRLAPYVNPAVKYDIAKKLQSDLKLYKYDDIQAQLHQTIKFIIDHTPNPVHKSQWLIDLKINPLELVTHHIESLPPSALCLFFHFVNDPFKIKIINRFLELLPINNFHENVPGLLAEIFPFINDRDMRHRVLQTVQQVYQSSMTRRTHVRWSQQMQQCFNDMTHCPGGWLFKETPVRCIDELSDEELIHRACYFLTYGDCRLVESISYAAQYYQAACMVRKLTDAVEPVLPRELCSLVKSYYLSFS